MALNLYRRHRRRCVGGHAHDSQTGEYHEKQRAWKKCVCPIFASGVLGNNPKFRQNTGKIEWRDAEKVGEAWEAAGAPVPVFLSLPPNSPTPSDGGRAPESSSQTTVEAGVTAYMESSKSRGNSTAALYKKEGIFARRTRVNPKDKTGPRVPVETSSLLSFCDKHGYRFLSELTLTVVENWRASWKVNDLVRSKRQKQVLGFFWFCERRGWYPRNYAAEMTEGLGKIEVRRTQTGYFEPLQHKAIIDATYVYSDRPSVDKHNSFTIGGHRIRALTELMRWTGLRIGDAVTLERYRLSFDSVTGLWRVMVYQRKTGDPVYCPIPPHVADLLNTVPASQKGNANERYFFWTGDGLPKTIISNWQRSYKRLFQLAGLKNADGTPKRCYPHMFRDTFAVESILANMPVHRVSEILGHSSVQITEKHYLPWVRARQSQLNDAVVASWVQQGVIPDPQTKRGPGRPPKVMPMPTAVNG